MSKCPRWITAPGAWWGCSFHQPHVPKRPGGGRPTGKRCRAGCGAACSQAACGDYRSPEGHGVARRAGPGRTRGCSHHPDAHPTPWPVGDTDATPSGGPHGCALELGVLPECWPEHRGTCSPGLLPAVTGPGASACTAASGPGDHSPVPSRLTTATASKSCCFEVCVDTKGHFSCTSRMDFRASAVQSATIQPQSSVLKGKAPCGTPACDGRWAPARAAAPNRTCVAGPAFQHDDPHRLPAPTATLGPPRRTGTRRGQGAVPTRGRGDGHIRAHGPPHRHLPRHGSSNPRGCRETGRLCPAWRRARALSRPRTTALGAVWGAPGTPHVVRQGGACGGPGGARPEGKTRAWQAASRAARPGTLHIWR